nr:hypothetical protein [Kibdelosporangium sp. MJ126-NF4]CTQ89353.1 hypothetical protein [Kibdelosporangium sp. MJ126-NF4]
MIFAALRADRAHPVLQQPPPERPLRPRVGRRACHLCRDCEVGIAGHVAFSWAFPRVWAA